MNKELIVDLVKRLPQGTVSRAWGWLARRKHPKPGIAALKRVFVAATGINMEEAGAPITHYASLEDLFVRRLRPGARRVDNTLRSVASPVDGKVGMCGVVDAGTLLQVKGRSYSLGRLLGDDEEAARFEGGSYATFYLSPRDYHRIHAPVAGKISDATLIPGGLLPVFPEALGRVDELFARNERFITYLDSPDVGRVAIVKVGATLVGRISVAYDPHVWTNRRGQKRMQRLHYELPHLVQKGGDIGAFELGSTVVMVCEPNRVAFSDIEPGVTIRMGQRIGFIQGQSTEPSRSRTRSPGRRPPRTKSKSKS